MTPAWQGAPPDTTLQQIPKLQGHFLTRIVSDLTSLAHQCHHTVFVHPGWNFSYPWADHETQTGVPTDRKVLSM